MAISVKKNGDVLAACDDSLLGKRFEEKDLILDLRESFYKGELVGDGQFCRMLSEASNINLVGEETIRTARKAKIVRNVGRIAGVPYAIIFKV